MSELAIREIPSLEKFRRSLDELGDKADLEHVLAITDAAIAYAKVTKSVELMNDAVELRLWTERRAGQLVARDDPADTAAELHTRSPIVKRWIFFASIPNERFEEHIAEIRQDRDLSIMGMFERIVFWEGRDVSKGVRKLPDGRHRITWTTLEGVKKTKLVDGNYRFARGIRDSHVYEENERKLVRQSKTWKRLDVAYGRVRRLLGELDAMAPTTSKWVREDVDTAISGLHVVEDALSNAMHAEEVDFLSDKHQKEDKQMVKNVLKAAEEAGLYQ